MYTPPPPSPAESLSLGQASRQHFEDRRMGRGRAGKWVCSSQSQRFLKSFGQKYPGENILKGSKGFRQLSLTFALSKDPGILFWESHISFKCQCIVEVRELDIISINKTMAKKQQSNEDDFCF